MPKITIQAEKVHGLVFDGANFFGSIINLSFVPTLGDEVVSTTGGALLLLAVASQMAGALLKRAYLPARLANRRESSKDRLKNGFLSLLLFNHFLLFSVISLFGFSLLGIYDIQGSGGFYQGDVWVFISLVVGGLCTYFVFLAERGGPTAARRREWAGWLEFGADGLLWISVSLVTRIFWDGLVEIIEPSRGIGLNSTGLVLMVAMSILYLFFYLPSRYLFLVEDYRSGWTWIQISVAMLPVIWLVVVG